METNFTLSAQGFYSDFHVNLVGFILLICPEGIHPIFPMTKCISEYYSNTLAIIAKSLMLVCLWFRT